MNFDNNSAVINEILDLTAASTTSAAPSAAPSAALIVSKPLTTLEFEATDNIALGEDGLRDVKTAEELCRRSGLGWTVSKEPLVTSGGTPVADHFALVRSDTGEALDVVGKSYIPVQNNEALSMLDGLIAAGAQPVGAGSFKGGRITFAQVDVGVGRAVGGSSKDRVDPFVMIRNGHGVGSLIARWNSVRIVCRNTLQHSSSAGQLLTRIRHTKGVEMKMEDAKKVLNALRDEGEKLLSVYDFLAMREVTQAEVQSILATVYPDADPSQKKANEARAEERAMIAGFINGAGMGAGWAGQTAWGVVNGITQFEDHVHGQTAKTADTRLESMLSGAISNKKSTGFETVVEMLGLQSDVRRILS